MHNVKVAWSKRRNMLCFVRKLCIGFCVRCDDIRILQKSNWLRMYLNGLANFSILTLHMTAAFNSEIQLSFNKIISSFLNLDTFAATIFQSCGNDKTYKRLWLCNCVNKNCLCRTSAVSFSQKVVIGNKYVNQLHNNALSRKAIPVTFSLITSIR